ncbi:MAG: type VI secretion system-associated protein TagF [Methyloprofundus sp.]|nr:type VI secretion system-associated protein TagF [Methyloprofundus sp.]
MSKQNLTLGFYGKLPSLGDFVSRRLAQDFIASWDSWLQSSLAVSRESLGEQWLDQYLTSPIWRFALSPGLAGKGAWLGIVMPSVDRVGRYFPLTIACEVPANVSLIQLFVSECDWFEELESVAISALENDLAVEEFDSQVKGITALKVGTKSRPPHAKEQSQGNNAFYLEFDSTRIKTECILPSLTSLLLDTYSPGHSLWCSVGSDNIKPGVLVVDGMPPYTAYIGMITGNFLQTGWALQQQQVEQSTQQSVTKMPSGGESVNEQVHIYKERYTKVNTITATPEQRALNGAWQSFAKTDSGKVRKYNEDAILDRPDLGLWVVADGMGGHQAGDVASRKIIDTLNGLHLSLPLESTVTQVKAALQLVNNELKELAARSYGEQIIGSTVVALIGGSTHFACLWAGDSRLYRLRDKKLLQLTIDHCSEQEYIADILDIGVNTELKQNNVITRAVGAYDELELDCQIFEVQSGDLFLLSSDGLDKELSFQEIEQVLADNVYNDSVEILLERVLQSSARDNVSVIVVEIK